MTLHKAPGRELPGPGLVQAGVLTFYTGYEVQDETLSKC
jgi:hypothetical protein